MWPCCRSNYSSNGSDSIPLIEEALPDDVNSSTETGSSNTHNMPSPVPPRSAHSLLEVGFDIVRIGTNTVLLCIRHPSSMVRTSRAALSHFTNQSSSIASTGWDLDMLNAMMWTGQSVGQLTLLFLDPRCRRRGWRVFRAGLSAAAVVQTLLELAHNNHLLRSRHGMSAEEMTQRISLMFSDVVFLMYEGCYFMGEAVRCVRDRVRRIADNENSEGTLQQVGRVLSRVHRAFHRRVRQTANMVGAAGLTLAATLSATVTVQVLNEGGPDSGIEAAVLAAQSAVIMAAATAFGWMFARGLDRARQ